MTYDVIVIGASFAGLSLATRIRGRVLLIDRKSIGALSTSACATPLEVLDELGCQDAILQTVSEVSFSTSCGTIRYKLPKPFCTFDYWLFCQRLFSRFKGDFLKTQVVGVKGNVLLTKEGKFRSLIIVDCTGWRASLACLLKEGFVEREKIGFGLETEIPCKHDDRLYFVFDPNLLRSGYAWIFPAGEVTRFGIFSYRPQKNLVEILVKFLNRYNLKPNKICGGYVPQGLREPTLANLFLVGDSAGQVLPLTIEGIRQSIYFGLKCAEIIQKIIDGELDLEEGQEQYRFFVNKHRRIYTLFSSVQFISTTGPVLITHLLAKMFRHEGVSCSLLKRYFDWFKVSSEASN